MSYYETKFAMLFLWIKIFLPHLKWLNTVLRAVSGNSRDGECFKYTDDDFSKSAH